MLLIKISKNVLVTLGVKAQDWKSFAVHVRKRQDCFEQIVGRNREDASGEASNGNEQHTIGHEWEVILVIKNFIDLCSSVLCKVEFVSNEIGYLAEEVSKQNIKGMGQFNRAIWLQSITLQDNGRMTLKVTQRLAGLQPLPQVQRAQAHRMMLSFPVSVEQDCHPGLRAQHCHPDGPRR